MDENYYPKLQKALQYLDDNRIPGVHIISGHTSDPFFGQGKSRQYDRLDIQFSYQNNCTEVPCQVVFDSSDYNFSPDIIINPTWQAFSNEQLLLLEWHIDDPKCLHQWLSSLWIHFNQMLFGNEEYDELQSSREPTPIDLTTPLEQPISIVSAPAALPESSVEELYHPITISSNTRQTSSIISFSDDRELPELHQVSHQQHNQDEGAEEEAEVSIIEEQSTFVEEDSTMDFEYLSLIERRAFIEQLISDMPNHVIRFDAINFSSIALYMTVKIPDVLWNELKVYHQKVLNDITTKVCKARNTAAAIVQLTMDEAFPQSPLSIVLISAVNTIPLTEGEPEQRQFEIVMNSSLDPEQMCKKVKDTLIEEIPKFHSGLFDNNS